MIRLIVPVWVLLPWPVAALTLDFASPATQTASRAEALGSYQLPVGPWRGGSVETLLTEGAITQTAWRVESGAMTTLQLLAPLREQLTAMGFRLLYECEATSCGGFDFRFETDVMAEPEMHVDLGDFRFLSAERAGPEAMEYVSLLVSRSSDSGFVQLMRVGAPEPAQQQAPADAVPELSGSDVLPEVLLPDIPVAGLPVNEQVQAVGPDPLTIAPPGSLVARLEAGGSVPLEDLSFPSGSAELAPGEFASLGVLAAYLKANPDRQIMLVGHTDASGGLESNIALSRRRAASVVDRLVDEFGVARAQVAAQGVGFLAPRASNLTEEGRQKNRRVEVVLTSTQ